MTPAGVVPEVVEEAEWIDGPDPVDFAPEGERLVPVRLDEREVVARLRRFGTGCDHRVVERSDRVDPDLGHGDRGDERCDARGRGCAGDGVVDPGCVEAAAHYPGELARLPG